MRLSNTKSHHETGLGSRDTAQNRPTARFSVLLVALIMATVSALSPAASAGQFSLTISDVDLRYDMSTGMIYDYPATDFGNLDSAEADPVATSVIEVDGDVTNVISSNAFVDLMLSALPVAALQNLGAPIALGSNGFGIDWFTDGASSESKLRLDVEQVSITQNPSIFFLSTQGAVTDQMLPDGMIIDGPVTIAYLSTTPVLQMDGEGGIDVVASGALIISAALIPEPTALASILGVVAAMSGVSGRRR